MGGHNSVINQIASGVSNAISTTSNNLNQIRKDPTRNVMAPMFGGALGASAIDSFRARTAESQAPQAPGIDSNLTDIQKAQQNQYDQYKKNLPQMQAQMQERLTKQANTGIAGAQRRTEQSNSARGLGYGGINEGMKAQDAAQGQQQLAGQIAGANKGLLDLGNQIQAGGLQTGLGVQSQLQQMQDAIYRQQMAQQNANNSIAGSGLGLIANAGMMMARG